MSDPIREGYEELMRQTKESDEAAQIVEDNTKLDQVVSNEFEIFLKQYGTLVFVHPNTRLTLQGDAAASKFMSLHLRHGDILTENQLKAIYGQPTTVLIDGKTVSVGDGSWTEKEEQTMENLPSQIDKNMEMVLAYRVEIGEILSQLDLLETKKESEEYKTLNAKLEKLNEVAFPLYLGVLKDRKRLVELQTKRLHLFSASLEEQTFLEKIKIYLPSCVRIKKDGEVVPLWKNEEEFLDDNIGAVHVLSLYNLFLRGVDVSFFADAPEGEIPSPDINTQKTQASPSL